MLQASGFAPGVAEARAALAERWRAMGLHGDLTVGQAVMEGPDEARLVIRSDTRPADIEGPELRARSLAIARSLAALGVRQGDVVAFQLPTWAETVCLTFAVQLLGAVLAPIISIYGPKEVGFILKQSRAKVLVTPDRWGAIDYLANMAGWPELPHLEHVVVIGGGERPGRAVGWEDFLAREADFGAPEIKPDDVCLLVYTSGTTSDPKGVLHTHRTLLAPKRREESARDSRVRLAALPMGHIGGVMTAVAMMAEGQTVVSLDRWAAAQAVGLVEEFKVIGCSGAPFFLTTMLEEARRQGRDISSLKNFMLGATAITPADVLGCESAGIRGYRAYGSTEQPVCITGISEDPLEIRANSEGFCCEGTQARMLDENGQDLPDGEAGELALIGPQQFIGYTDPAINAVQFIEGGWFLTGDVARRDPTTGAIILTDRKKDIIIRGGENISAKEVEDALTSMPEVLEAAVVAMPDARYGEKVCAFVVLREGREIGLEGVRSHFAGQGLARQKTPERIEVVADFPRTAMGKIKKFELRDRLRAEVAA